MITGHGHGDGATSPSDGSPLSDWIERQHKLSSAAMLESISAAHLVKRRPGFGQTIRPANGSVLASPQIAAYDPDPDYFFHWLRDSAIVIDAARTLIEDGTYDRNALNHVRDFIRFSLALCDLDGGALTKAAVNRAVDPKLQQYVRPDHELNQAAGSNVLGEARFNPDGTLDITKWARPQHDGPALRALTMLRFLRGRVLDDAESRLGAGRLLEIDLEFTHRRWRAPSFDIWEEEIGRHYYTQLVQCAALSDGAAWLGEIGEGEQARVYRAASDEIAQALNDHWDAAKGFYLSRIGATSESRNKELDVATILGVIHARRMEGPHSVFDPKAQATLDRLERLFREEYPINTSPPAGRGVAMGRYAGDRYYSGGAYYFSTLGAAEFFFRLAEGLVNRSSSDRERTNRPGERSVAEAAEPSYRYDARQAMARGDEFMATVRAYTPATGELSEQFDRANGGQTSSKNLAWSHAAFITAAATRRAALDALRSRLA